MFDITKLDEMVKKSMKMLDVPGVQIGIVEKGKVIYQKAFGYADIENNIPMRTEHYLPIGSSTKSFTATAIMQLVEKGELDIDAPIRNYIPEFEIYDKYLSGIVTTRDLLCHRTGVPRHEMMWVNWDDLDREDLVLNRIKHLEANTDFRTTFQYQNQMYVVLGYLIERITGQKWESYVSEHIMKPLGIEKYSYCVPYLQDTLEYAKLYAGTREQGYQELKPLIIDAIGPAGSINMPISSFITWLKWNLKCGNTCDILSEQYFKELTKINIPYTILPFDVPGRKELGYSMGWTIDEYKGYRIVDHGGNVNGATALISYIPEKELGCVILTNANSSMFGYAFSMMLYDYYLSEELSLRWFDLYSQSMKDLIAEMTKEIMGLYERKIEKTKYSHELSAYCGTFSHQGYGDITIKEVDGNLTARLHENTLDLSHHHYDVFTFILFGSPFTLNFLTSADGEINALEIPLEPAVKPIVFKRISID